MSRMNGFKSATVGLNKSPSPHTENLIKEQILRENPMLAYNLHELRKEILKRMYKMMNIDSAYFLG